MHSILAVDDSASMRQMVSFTLKNAGFHVVEAVDGQDAWEKASSRDFSLVLTDQNMPRMDGIGLTRRLRENPKFRTTPILILTTESSDQMKQAGPRRRCHRLAGQALRPGQAGRGHRQGHPLSAARARRHEMGEMSQEGAQLSIGTDLSQFFQVFFEEAGENLDTMEQMLLHLDLQTADDEELNAVFRCAHSVKGGAATFGFTDVAELTHEMETLLDKLRRHELAPTPDMVDVLLAAGDVLKAQLARHNGHAGEAPDTTALRASIRALVDGGGAPARATPELATATPEQNPADAAAAATAAPATIAATGERLLELTVGPLDDPALADNLIELFREIGGLGTIDALDAGRAADGMRRFKVVTTSSDNDLLDLFSFHVAREQVRLAPLGPGYGFHAGAPGAPPDAAEATDAADDAADAPSKDPGWGFFDDAPGAPEHPAAAPSAHAPGDGRQPRVEHAARVGREGRPADQPGRRARDHAGHAGRRTAKGIDAARTSSCWPGWPTWSATRATCRKR
jgi:CheY-like chemotaxis protein